MKNRIVDRGSWIIGGALLLSSIIHHPPSAQAAEQITLEFWELSVSEELMRSLLDKFERQNPGIQVQFQQLSWDYGLEKIITAIAAGNAPDVVELGTDQVPQFSASGVLQDLTEALAPLKDQYLLWEPVTYQGRLYGMPWLAGTRILFYNRELFAEAGLNPAHPPATWEQLYQAAQAIDGLRPDIHGVGLHVGQANAPWQQFLPFAWGNGGQVLSDDASHCLLDQPPVLEALEFYRSLKPFALMGRVAQVDELFAEGKVGVQISGAWNFSVIPRRNPTLNYGVGLLPRPRMNKGTPASFAGGEVLVVLKGSKHPEAALKLIRFLAEEEQAMEIVELQRNVVPCAKAAMQHPYYRLHPEQRLYFEQARYAVAAPVHPGWVKMQEKVTRAVEEVILNDREPAEALRQARKEIDRILQAPVSKEGVGDTRVFGGVGVALLALLAGGWVLRRRRNRVRSTWKRSRWGAPLFFVSPWLVLFFAFSFIPLIHSFLLSFSHYNLLTDVVSFVGLRNFWEVLREPAFLRALWHTVAFAIGTIPITMALALFSAVLINTKIPFKRLYQAGLFLPVVTSVIVIATIFTYLYAQDGPINRILQALHLPVPDPPWLLNSKGVLGVSLALGSIMWMNVWASFGYYMVLFLAGLQTIPVELYEAASIDGANEWQKFRYVTLPQLKPIVLLAVVINTIRTLQVFPEVFAMTQGGPLGATTTVVYYLYETGFRQFDMGRAAAVGYILFLITMGFSWVQIRAFKVEETS